MLRLVSWLTTSVQAERHSMQIFRFTAPEATVLSWAWVTKFVEFVNVCVVACDGLVFHQWCPSTSSSTIKSTHLYFFCHFK